MSASDAQRACPDASASSTRICRHAATRYPRWRTGSLARSSAATASRTVSWTTRPSRPSSTKGSARSRSNAADGDSPGKRRRAATASRGAARRSRRAPRACRSRARRGRARRAPARPSAAPRPRARPAARGWPTPRAGASGWPRTKRLTHAACAFRPAARSTSAASAGESGPSGTMQASSPNDDRHTAPGASRVASTTRVLRQRGQELLAQPAVEQAQLLRRVDGDHHAAAGRGEVCAERGEGRRASAPRCGRRRPPRPRRGPPPRRGTPAQRRLPPATPWTTATSGPSSPSSRRSAASFRVAADDRGPALGQQGSEGPHRGQAGSGSGD